MNARAGVRASAVVVAAPHTGLLETSAFLLIVFGGAAAVAAMGPSPLLLALALWLPGIAALVLTRLAGGPTLTRLGLDRLGAADAYLAAVWLPVAMAAAPVALAAPGGLAALDDVRIQQLAAMLTVAPLVNMAVALGSELGWRAYLLPRLGSLGRWRSILIVAAAWAVWQVSLSPALASDRTGGDAALQLAWCVLIGAILGWLFVRTRSPWAPALFAGTLAATSSLPLLFLREAPGTAAPSALGLAVPALALLGVCLAARRTSGG